MNLQNNKTKNFTPLPNEIFSLHLSTGELATYAVLMRLEDPRTYECWPSYETIGKAIGKSKSSVKRYVAGLVEKGLITVAPTSVIMRNGLKKNGNLRYHIRPIREKTVEQLISGVNCVAWTAVPEFEAVKKQFRKTEGRGYYHIVQAFAPDDPLDFATAHELGVKLAEHFEGYQCIVVTHMNTAHIHNHIIMNSVNFETGMKFHQSAREMQQVKDYCSQLCQEYGLSVTESKADPFRIPMWKRRLTDHIKEAMEQSRTQQEFVAYMNAYGYDVKWEPHQKYITYTTPENIRCRDSKLFDQTLKRENMELYFRLGGADYLQACREIAYDHREPTPTLEDAVCGMAGTVAAICALCEDEDSEVSDLARELYYSSLLLQELVEWYQSRRQEQENYEEEYEQYHGFDMTMM